MIYRSLRAMPRNLGCVTMKRIKLQLSVCVLRLRNVGRLWIPACGRRVLLSGTGYLKDMVPLIMANTNLKIATYNLHGLRQGSPFLQAIGNSCDIIYTQEHWLAPFDINLLDNMLPGFICYATSAMTDVISKSVLCGRPFGGVAIFVRQHLAANVKVI